MSPALSIRQPWAWLIIHGGKDIENRDWPTQFRGRVLIHASKSHVKREYHSAIEFLQDRGLDDLISCLPTVEEAQRGGIVGSVEIIDCVTQSASPWFTGSHGFVLSKPRPLPFAPWPGRLGFFNVEGIQP